MADAQHPSLTLAEIRRDPHESGRRILAALVASNSSRRGACDALGVDYSTFYRWLAFLRKKAPGFSAALRVLDRRNAAARRDAFVEAGRRGGRPSWRTG